jgi:ABC-type hemin transport system ATPase subunit
VLSDSDKKKYQSIKAPESLKARVMADCQSGTVKKTKRTVNKYVQVIAACLLVVFVIGFVGAGKSSSTVYLNGDVFNGEKIILEQSSTEDAVQRATFSSRQVVEINARFTTEVSVSGGQFTLTDVQTGEQIYSGNKYSVKGKVLIEIHLEEGDKGVLTLENIFGKKEISVQNQ